MTAVTADVIENRTFDEIAVGDTASLTRTLSRQDIALFAVMSGDVNPAHVDEEYAKSDMFHTIIAHGMWGGALISTLLGTVLPGPGTIYLGQTLRFRRPVRVGDTVTVSVTVAATDPDKGRVTLECACVNQVGETVISGTADVVAPTDKVKRPRVVLPTVRLHDRGARYRELVERCRGLAPLTMAVVHPVDPEALRTVAAAAEAGLIAPILVGPETRIRAAADAAGVGLAAFPLSPTAHSHEAADRAVAMAHRGEVEALLRGNLLGEELLRAVCVPAAGLATARCRSHVFLVDVPTYPRLLLVTDGALNAEPDLEAKRDIVQNVIDLARALGVERPRVAILAAVEKVTPHLKSTLDAAALCKMADRGQITGGVVDGPLGFDDAVSDEAAAASRLDSPVAGRADVIVVPDLEAGNMLVDQLQYLAEGQAAGIVLGLRVPIVMPDRRGERWSRLAACAAALLLVRSGIGRPAPTIGR
jgi:phosphate acetyltransferase/phosphate butyryltransferase